MDLNEWKGRRGLEMERVVSEGYKVFWSGLFESLVWGVGCLLMMMGSRLGN